MDVSLFSSDSHVIIKTRKVDPRAEGGARILIKESDRDVSSLEKSSTDIVNHNPINEIGLQSGLSNPAIQSSNTL